MTALGADIAALIRAEGPITVERYMALCLGHPLHGYYMTRDPFGAEGDFVTAPEISQIFGELIGLWAAQVWLDMGQPAKIRLVEIGPGRGTLMADALRAIGRAMPPLLAAAEVWLVETSPVLRARQQALLAGAGASICWTGQPEAALEGPVLLIANELLDALPVRQFVATERGWCERLVGLEEQGGLAFGLAAEPTRPCGPGHRPGLVVELPAASDQIVGLIASHLASAGGAALLIDYGSTEDGTGDTLQAVRRHQFADPLVEPGEADLTTQVNFARVGDIAARAGARVHGPVPQAHLLAALGLGARAANLKRQATPEQAKAIDAAVLRLTSMEERGMGALFKAIGLSHPSLVTLPGLAGPET